MDNAIYRGRTYGGGKVGRTDPERFFLFSRKEQEGFLPRSDGYGYYTKVSASELEDYYIFDCYAVFQNAKCFILRISDDMSTMAFEEWGRTLLERYQPKAQIENGCYLYENIPIQDADGFEIEFMYQEKPHFDRTVSKVRERYSYQEFVDKYRELVLDV